MAAVWRAGVGARDVSEGTSDAAVGEAGLASRGQNPDATRPGPEASLDEVVRALAAGNASPDEVLAAARRAVAAFVGRTAAGSGPVAPAATDSRALLSAISLHDAARHASRQRRCLALAAALATLPAAEAEAACPSSSRGDKAALGRLRGCLARVEICAGVFELDAMEGRAWASRRGRLWGVGAGDARG